MENNQNNTQNGSLSVSDIHGSIMQLMTNFQGKNGDKWLIEFKKFLRKENTWESEIAKKLRRFSEEGTVFTFGC